MIPDLLVGMPVPGPLACGPDLNMTPYQSFMAALPDESEQYKVMDSIQNAGIGRWDKCNFDVKFKRVYWFNPGTFGASGTILLSNGKYEFVYRSEATFDPAYFKHWQPVNNQRDLFGEQP